MMNTARGDVPLTRSLAHTQWILGFPDANFSDRNPLSGWGENVRRVFGLLKCLWVAADFCQLGTKNVANPVVNDDIIFFDVL